MPDTYLTLLDIAKLNAAGVSDDTVGLIEDNIHAAPEAELFPARTVTGTSFTTLHRESLPTTQFRHANEGVYTSKSGYSNKIHELAYLDGKLEMDVAVAQAAERGEAYALLLEASGMAEANIQHIGRQVWYGTGNDAKGFQGAQQLVDDAYVLDAGGTTASTGSSVYGVRLGERYSSLVFGLNRVMDMGDWTKQRIERTGGHMTAWINSLEGWVGFSLVSKNSLCRLKDATEDSGKGVTDAKLAQLLSQLKWTPDRWFMTRRSLFQLQMSRTPTSNTSGVSQNPIAPPPVESNGIPIVVTDSLSNTEALS